jgi:signal transduction histidine kinase/DNA-binding NarL/FixJ family response regulator
MDEHTGSVLVVDDSELNLDLLSRYIERLGLDVTTARDGQQALDLLKTRSFDLMLLDIMMPVMDGYQVLEKVKQDESLRYLPVIVISAVDDLRSVARCIELGAEDYLPKPFNQAVLNARINASLEKKRLRDQERAYLEELLIMQRIDHELNASLEITHAMSITLEWAIRQTGGKAGLVAVVEEDVIRIMVTQGYEGGPQAGKDTLPPSSPALRKVLEEREPRRLELGQEEPIGYLEGAQIRVVIPICRETDVIGLLLVEGMQSGCCTEDRLDFLVRLSNHAAIAIFNAQLYAAVQAANVAKSDFISVVSHELKMPMTSIKGYAELLAAGAVGPINDTQAEFLSTIRSNANRMEQLVSDLADISRVEAGRLQLDFEVVTISRVVDEVVRSMESSIDQKEQRLDVLAPPDLPPVWGDRTRLIQVLVNLTSNAHKYTPPGGRIAIHMEHTANRWDAQGAPEVVHVWISDDGIGISAADQEKIFQKFFRVQEIEHEEVEQVPGTGLGLNISKNLVELQGGRIWFESELGEGSTFHFTVPVADGVSEGA